MAGIISFEPVFDLFAANLNNHWSAVRAGIWVLTAVECTQ